MENLGWIVLVAFGLTVGLVLVGKALQHGGGRLVEHGSSRRGRWRILLVIVGAVVFAIGWLVENGGPKAVEDSVPRPPVPQPHYTVGHISRR
jgi:hypothetical protein